MPEYLAPGVYVEEVSFRSKSIEGVSTTTTGFIGPARYGPVDLEPDVITSLGEFERVYGDGQPLKFKDQAKPMDNYLWHAVRGFFEEGGKRLYIVRTFRAERDQDDPTRERIASEGRASARVPKVVAEVTPDEDDPDKDTSEARFPTALHVKARFPGELGNIRVRFTLSLGQNVLGGEPVKGRPGVFKPVIGALRQHDIVWISDPGSPITTRLGSPLASPLGSSFGAAGNFYRASLEPHPVTLVDTWYFYDVDDTKVLELSDLVPSPDPRTGDQIRVVTLAVTVFPSDPFDLTRVWAELPLDPRHQQQGTNAPDSLADVFALHPANRAQEYRLPIVVTLGRQLKNGLHILNTLDQGSNPPGALLTNLRNATSADADRSFDIKLKDGNDGDRPSAAEYAGTDDPSTSYKTGLKSFEDIDDISIVAAPGSTFGFENGYRADASTIVNLLIAHATRMRYLIAVLDSGNDQSIAQVRAMRAKLDSKYAAFYYPWVRVLDPITRREIALPPSGFVAGIYARNDITRAVYKAPANEVVNLALGFEQLINKSQQDVLNPEGINCFRFFEGRGFRLWGARTISSDPEWKYVNLRRYFAYLEHSIDKGTQWAVFEPNGEALWANVRRTIEDFLLNEWQSGALLGDKPEKAFFVRCDRSTMTQNDLDNGRLVCLIGVVPLRPAEFVIFRIGQTTADAMRRG
jgi:phage tail sheath protein FI